MLQRFVDNLLAVTKESVKTFTYESLNNIARLINGVSALLLAVLPGKATILEGIHGWELRPTLRGPRLPRWMENGVSSFNEFIHELSMDSGTSLNVDYISGEEDNEEDISPASPLSQTSRLSHASTFTRYDRRLLRLIKFLLSWILWPAAFFLKVPFFIYKSTRFGRGGIAPGATVSGRLVSGLNRSNKSISLKDNVVQRTTDRRRGVIEDLHLAIEIFIESVFDNVHKAAHYLLSPSEVYQILLGWFHGKDRYNNDEGVAIPTATLGDPDSTPTERHTRFHQSLNTDARTCEDFITELGQKLITGVSYINLFL